MTIEWSPETWEKTEIMLKQMKNPDHQDDSIVKIFKNLSKSPGFQMRLAATEMSVKDHLLTFVGKTRLELNNNNNEKNVYGVN